MKILKNLSATTTGAVLSGLLLTVAQPTKAALISFSPGERVPPLAVSPAFGSLNLGQQVGTAFLEQGVDFSFGGREGIFDDSDPLLDEDGNPSLDDEGNPIETEFVLAFSGVNNTNTVNLISPVDGRIVVPGTLSNGLTNFLAIEAGFSEPGGILLEVFNTSGNLLSSVSNDLSFGPNNRSILTIDRGNIFDISSFRVSTPIDDEYGVVFLQLETPVAAGEGQPSPTPVPGPEISPVLSFLTLGAWGAMAHLKRKGKQKALKVESIAKG